MTETRGIGRKALPNFICGDRSRKITNFCSKSIDWNIVKFLKSRYSENDHHFGETCMLRPHLGAKKGSRLKFPYLVCYCTFWSIYLLRQWDVVRCSSFPGEITYSCNSNRWNVRIPPKFNTATWWNTMSLWAQITSPLKMFLKSAQYKSQNFVLTTQGYAWLCSGSNGHGDISLHTSVPACNISISSPL